MKIIHKIPIQIDDTQVTSTQTVRVQPEAEVILVGLHPPGTPSIWVMVDPDKPTAEFILHVVATGHPVPPGTQHLGSFVQNEYVWHVFS